MEFGFTEEQEKLRQEVHDFLMNELPEDYNPHLYGPEHQDEELSSAEALGMYTNGEVVLADVSCSPLSETVLLTLVEE